jgi:hypothetical protein
MWLGTYISLPMSTGAGPASLHRGFIRYSSHGCRLSSRSGVHHHPFQGTFPETPGPFIGDSSRRCRLRMGPASRYLFPHRLFSDAGPWTSLAVALVSCYKRSFASHTRVCAFRGFLGRRRRCYKRTYADRRGASRMGKASVQCPRRALRSYPPRGGAMRALATLRVASRGWPVAELEVPIDAPIGGWGRGSKALVYRALWPLRNYRAMSR